jgi:uncharacterized BrkB/YihY/UPF0761 family membrane protein
MDKPKKDKLSKAKLKFSNKFYWGIFLVVLNFVLGKIGQYYFFKYFDNPKIRWISLIFYILSWIPLIVGIMLIGREYIDAVRKYFTFKYYGVKIKNSAKKVARKSKAVKDKATHRYRKKKRKKQINQMISETVEGKKN